MTGLHAIGRALAIASVSANTVIAGQDVVFASGTIQLTLPSALTATKPVYIKNVGTGTVTVVGPSAQTIDGASQLDIKVLYEAYIFVSDGTNWKVL
jgi:hypothetical protein